MPFLSDFLIPAGSFASVSPAGSFTSRYPQTCTYLDGFEAPSSPRYGFTDPITANMGGRVTFEPPELPEETLMEVRSSVLNSSRKQEKRSRHLCILCIYAAITLQLLCLFPRKLDMKPYRSIMSLIQSSW